MPTHDPMHGRTDTEYRERLGHELNDEHDEAGADIIRVGECPRCLARGATEYNGTTIVCPDCLGTGLRRRRLYEGAPVHAGTGHVIGDLEPTFDSDEPRWTIRVYDGETRPPYLGEVRDAAAVGEVTYMYGDRRVCANTLNFVSVTELRDRAIADSEPDCDAP